MAHGGGGRETSVLIDDLILKHLSNPILNKMEDAAVLDDHGRFVFTTDSFVVKPLFFPGGDIGKLAVYGTVNDLAVMGAIPKYLSLALILEEGMMLGDLEQIIKSVAEHARQAGVEVVCGDTKVVEKGNGDGVFINTSGIGILKEGISLSISNCRPGDTVIINGPSGDHGATILGAGKKLEFTSGLESDCVDMTPLITKMLETGCRIRALRDVTRGGVAAVSNEIGKASGVTVVINKKDVPVRMEVEGVCNLLGMDPLDLANEGKVIAVVHPEDTSELISSMQEHPLGREAAVIGCIEAKGNFNALLKTELGIRNILEMPRGELLPRIC